MDRDFLQELFAGFGPVTSRRMFGGYGISADGTNFALMLRGTIYLRTNDKAVPQFEAEGAQPFQYQARGKTVIVKSYWQLPERLYDDPEELTTWARAAFTAAKQASASKRPRKKSIKPKAVRTSDNKARPLKRQAT